jgi:hypothetical protein
MFFVPCVSDIKKSKSLKRKSPSHEDESSESLLENVKDCLSPNKARGHPGRRRKSPSPIKARGRPRKNPSSHEASHEDESSESLRENVQDGLSPNKARGHPGRPRKSPLRSTESPLRSTESPRENVNIKNQRKSPRIIST